MVKYKKNVWVQLDFIIQKMGKISFEQLINCFLTFKIILERVSLVQSCLEKCRGYCIKVTSITCDGPVVNVSMLKKLGVSLDPDNIQSELSVPYLDHPPNAVLDNCHMLKNIR